LVTALLERPGGRLALQAMLGLLPRTLNWQTAFLQAFQPLFPRLLEVEHWWALTTVHFLAGTQLHAWSRELTLRKLENVLRVPVDRRTAMNAPPQDAVFSLQRMIRETSYPQHRALLGARISQLLVVQASGAAGLAPLIRQYAAALQKYAQQPPRSLAPGARAASAGIERNPLALQTVSRLDELDRQRAALWAAGPQVLQPQTPFRPPGATR